MINTIYEWLRDAQDDEEEKIVNTEAETMVEQPEIQAVCIEQRHFIKKHRYLGGGPIVEPKPKTFTDLKELENHILDRNTREKNYLYKRGNDEVRKTIKEAFEERRCRKLENKKQRAKEELEEAEKKMEDIKCDE